MSGPRPGDWIAADLATLSDPKAELFQALGRWSTEICRPTAQLAPPQYLLDAIERACTPAPLRQMSDAELATELECQIPGRLWREADQLPTVVRLAVERLRAHQASAETAAAELEAIARKREAVSELRTLDTLADRVCAIAVVGKIDGREVIRRESVIEVVDFVRQAKKT